MTKRLFIASEYIYQWHDLDREYNSISDSWSELDSYDPHCPHDEYSARLSHLISEMETIERILSSEGWHLDQRYRVWVKG